MDAIKRLKFWIVLGLLVVANVDGLIERSMADMVEIMSTATVDDAALWDLRLRAKGPRRRPAGPGRLGAGDDPEETGHLRTERHTTGRASQFRSRHTAYQRQPRQRVMVGQ